MRRTNGQALVLLALIMALLAPLVFALLEAVEAQLTIAELEDALQQATHAAVMHASYAALAEDRVVLDAEAAVAAGQATWERRLTTLRGRYRAGDRDALRAGVTWTVVPGDGACRWANGDETPLGATGGVCAEVRPVVAGIWGLVVRPTIRAVAVVERTG